MDTALTLNKDNYDQMAALMGVASETESKAKKSTLSRLRIWNAGVKVKQNNRNVEVVPPGYFRVETAEGEHLFAEKVNFRPFLQRFMYKMWDNNNNTFIKTIMADNLNIDLKDTSGGFNCGKPTGYIEDFEALSDSMKDKIRQIKRVRVIFGDVELINAVDVNGENSHLTKHSVIWEIDNREAFKIMGEPFKAMSKSRKLPLQHQMNLVSEEKSLPTGASYFLPMHTLDTKNEIDIADEDQVKFKDFVTWIENYNKYVFAEWDGKNDNGVSDKDAQDVVDQFVDT